ncbi:MAG: hypothetical protein KAH15_01920, partial [Candidatus Marinimicrobia bacterium]|nr:hypothetical protein [Candidatus Neomarinimicrobiota bacterium]
MKKYRFFFLLIIIFTSLVFAAIPLSNRTWVRVGALQTPFDAWGAERGHDANLSMYVGLQWPAWFNRTDNFVIDRQFIACRNFTNKNGEVQPYQSTKFHTTSSPNQLVPMVLQQYGKYPYTEISVDGVSQYYSDYLNGNIDQDLIADRVVTNIIHTALGLKMTRKIYAFSQQYHDNYFIYEYTFENTGNIDDDAQIELSETIHDFYFGMMSRYCTSREARTVTNLRQAGWGAHQWVYHTPMIDDPEIPYFYTWLGQAKTTDITLAYDNVGIPFLPAEGTLDEARIRGPQFAGMAVLHTDAAYNDDLNDKSKVKTGWYIGDSVPGEGNDQQAWTCLSSNFQNLGTFDVSQDVYGGHKIADRLAPYTVIKDRGAAAGTNSYLSFGPYEVPFGETIKIVLCEGVAGLDRKKAIEVGKKWYKAYNGNNVDLTLPPDPEFRDPDPVDETAPMMDIYKDSWVYTGKDSIIKTFIKAKENYDSGYDISFPPPPPLTFDILPQPDQVSIEWADNPESDPDFEGYRLYRAMLEPDSFYHPIFECSVTEGDVATSYSDRALLRGINYYYYIVAYSIDPVLGELESGRAYTQTTIPTSLKKPPRDITDDGTLISVVAQQYALGQINDEERLDAVLGMVRIVPNPYNIKNRKITFGSGIDKDKLMFYNLPENCEIRIFTERGDLVDVLDHVTMEGMAAVADEAWNSSTASRQVVKSGVYIAHIRVTKDINESETGLPLLFEGESVIKKFIII